MLTAINLQRCCEYFRALGSTEHVSLTKVVSYCYEGARRLSRGNQCRFLYRRAISTGIEASASAHPPFERQEGIIFERLSSHFCAADTVHNILEKKLGIAVNENDILIMRSRAGRPAGRVGILTEEKILEQDIRRYFPDDIFIRVLDYYDVALFVEQCERYWNFADDLRWLARPEFFNRIVTITEIPKTYGRMELADVILQHSKITVEPRDIVFRFRKGGVQSDVAWVVCASERDARSIISSIQETAVPKRVQYGTMFGAAFLWAARSSLFITDPGVDFLIKFSKNQVFTTGWDIDVTVEDFKSLLWELKIYPKTITRFETFTGQNSFFLEFDRMKDAKLVMSRLQRIKKIWKLPQADAFFAFPRTADVIWACEHITDAEDSAADTDLDEPVEY